MTEAKWEVEALRRIGDKHRSPLWRSRHGHHDWTWREVFEVWWPVWEPPPFGLCHQCVRWDGYGKDGAVYRVGGRGTLICGHCGHDCHEGEIWLAAA